MSSLPYIIRYKHILIKVQIFQLQPLEKVYMKLQFGPSFTLVSLLVPSSRLLPPPKDSIFRLNNRSLRSLRWNQAARVPSSSFLLGNSPNQTPYFLLCYHPLLLLHLSLTSHMTRPQISIIYYIVYVSISTTLSSFFHVILKIFNKTLVTQLQPRWNSTQPLTDKILKIHFVFYFVSIFVFYLI